MVRKWSLLLVPFLLAACSDAREALGLNRAMPDESVVVDRAPLVVPPDFSLRPPQPGAPRPQETAATVQAETAVLGESAPATATPSAPTNLEQQVLMTAGADKSSKEIRKIVDQESANDVGGSRHLVDDLLWWRKQDAAANASVVDAAAEATRLRNNQAVGKAANAGPTPTIEKRKSGWLGL